MIIPHALAVNPKFQNKGFGKKVVDYIIKIAKENNKKTIRLYVLASNKIVEKLYEKSGFKFIESKKMYYEDTGLTEYKMFEMLI